MFKFLRKYNRTLLAVFGVLLMITFLIPQAFNQLSQRAAAHSGTFATVGDGETISNVQLDELQQELRVMERKSIAYPGLGVIQKPEHWFLLVREAKQAGVVPVLDGRDASDPVMQQLMGQTEVRDPNVIMQAAANIRGVGRLLELYQTGGLYSDRRLRAESERLLHIVAAEMVVIQPDPEKSTLQPTPQQIDEQMKKYADKLPGEGEMGFGYELPNRVKIEWLKVSADSVRKIVEQSAAMDSVQQRLHWKRNPNKNLPPYPTDGAAHAIPDAVRNDLLKQLTREKTEEISKFAVDTLRLSRRGLPEKDGYLVLPDDWAQKRMPFPQLAEEIRNDKRFAGIDLPEYTARGDKWLTIDDVANLPGIGRSTSDKVGARPVPFVELVKAAKELGGNPTIIVQTGVDAPPLKDAQQNLYFFRITEADPAHVPASVDEVREQVVKDLKRKAEYDRLKGSLADIESAAKANGLLQAALDHDTIVQPMTGVYLWNEYVLMSMLQQRNNTPLTARPSDLPVIGPDRKTIEAIINRARAMPMDKPIDQVPADQRIFAVAADDKLALLVVNVTGQRPLTRESFERLAQSGAVQKMISLEEAGEERSIEKAFSFESLAKRHNFALKHVKTEEETTKTGAGEPPKTAAAS